MFLITTIAALTLAATQPNQVRSGPVWRTLPAVTHDNLAIFPVVYSKPLEHVISAGYITLDEGLKAGTVEVTEKGAGGPPIQRNRSGQTRTNNHQQTIGSGAQVNELWLTNKSGKKLILLAGELVVGGQQDRIVQKDMIIPPSSTPVAMNVFCVEQGRWSGATKFEMPATASGGRGGALADPSVRGAAQGKGQNEVWANVADKNAKSKATSGGTTYQQTLRAQQNKTAASSYLKQIESAFPKQNVIGVVVSVNGHLIWLDVFMDAGLFRRYWPKLLDSYIIEAATEKPATKVVVKHPTAYEAQAFLNRISGVDGFEGKEGVYKLVTVDGKTAKTYELFDTAHNANLLVHFNKMLKK